MTSREPMSFEFTCDGPGWKGVPVVNGHRILSATEISVRVDARAFPEVTLRLVASDAVKLGLGAAVVSVDDGTRDALISLGWTPPGDREIAGPAPRRNEITET